MMINKLLKYAIILILAIFSCGRKQDNNSQINKLENIAKISHKDSENDSIYRLKAMWLEDSNGCLGYRTKELSDFFIKKFLNKDSSKVVFQKIFGKPTEYATNGNMTTYRYVCRTLCLNGNPLDSDKTYIVYSFKDDKLYKHFVEAE